MSLIRRHGHQWGFQWGLPGCREFAQDVRPWVHARCPEAAPLL